MVRHSPGSKAGQGAREKASRPRTGPCCPLAKGEGDGSVETGSRALPSSPSWDPEKKETALFLKFFTTGRTEQKGNKRFSSRPSSGEGVVRSPSPEEQDPEAPGRPSQGCRLPWRFTSLAGAEAKTKGLQPAVGYRQLRTAGAGCDETPPSAFVRWRNVGQSPPPFHRIGQPGRSGSPGSDACRTPSYPPRSAIGGAPGPLMWTSCDPGPAL